MKIFMTLFFVITLKLIQLTNAAQDCSYYSDKGCFKCIYKSFNENLGNSTCKWLPETKTCVDTKYEADQYYKHSYECCAEYKDCYNCLSQQDGCSWDKGAYDYPCSATQYVSRRRLSDTDFRRKLGATDSCNGTTTADASEEDLTAEWWFPLVLVIIIFVCVWMCAAFMLYYNEVNEYLSQYEKIHRHGKITAAPDSPKPSSPVHHEKPHAFIHFGEEAPVDAHNIGNHGHGHSKHVQKRVPHETPHGKERRLNQHDAAYRREKRTQQPKYHEAYSDTESGYSEGIYYHRMPQPPKRFPGHVPGHTPAPFAAPHQIPFGPAPPGRPMHPAHPGYSPFQHSPYGMPPMVQFPTPGGPVPPQVFMPGVTPGGAPPPQMFMSPGFPHWGMPPHGHWAYTMSHSRRHQNWQQRSLSQHRAPEQPSQSIQRAPQRAQQYYQRTAGNTLGGEVDSPATSTPTEVEDLGSGMHWSYDDETEYGPKNWHHYYPNASGLFQSPVNIETSNTDLIAHALKAIDTRVHDKFTMTEFRKFVNELGLKSIHDDEIEEIFESLSDDRGALLLVHQEDAISEIMPDITKQQMEYTILETLNALHLDTQSPRVCFTMDIFGLEDSYDSQFKYGVVEGIAMSFPELIKDSGKLHVTAESEPDGILDDEQTATTILVEIHCESEEIAHEICRQFAASETRLRNEIESECEAFGLEIKVGNISIPAVQAAAKQNERVDPEEFRHLIDYLHLKMTTADIRHMFEVIDRDASGDLDHDEIINELVPRLLVELRSQEITRALNLIVPDVKGVINRRELEELILHLGLHMTSEEIDDVFRQLDRGRGIVPRTNAIHGALLGKFSHKRLRMNVSNGSLSIHYSEVKAILLNSGFAPEWIIRPGCYIEHHNIKYNLEKIQYKMKSEHTLNGHHTELELQLVHRAENTQRNAILAILFNLGTKHSHDFFVDELTADLEPMLPDEQHDCKLDLSMLTDYMHTHYCHYEGSLTQPPCTENVLWFVNLTVYHIAPDQYEQFHNCLSSRSNNRPTQPFHDRLLTIIS